MRSNWRKTTGVAASFLALSLVVAACGDNDDDSSGSSDTATQKSGTIGLLLPETKTTRYEAQDRPLFTDKVKALCADCKVEYQNADQSADKQLSQADALLTNGAKVLVLDPVDSAAAATIVAHAKAQNVPVISYDRLVKNAEVDYYISFDNEQVGRLQGQALLKKLTDDGTLSKGEVVMINGSPTDNNATLFKKGAHSVLDGKATITKEYDTADWSNDKAQQEMEQAITALGKDKIVGVYAANDGEAGGAIAALKAAGLSKLPPVTGQDAEVAGIQRIIAGEQYMTVYKAIKPEAEGAAELAVALIQGTTPPATQGTTNNGTKDVPSILLTPVSVTKDNLKTTVFADNFVTKEEVCTAAYAAACTAAGIS